MASLACVWFPEQSVQKAIWARRRERERERERERHAFTFTTSYLLPALEREIKSRVQSRLYPEKAAQKPSLKQLNCPENMHLQRQIIFRKDNVMKLVF